MPNGHRMYESMGKASQKTITKVVTKPNGVQVVKVKTKPVVAKPAPSTAPKGAVRPLMEPIKPVKKESVRQFIEPIKPLIEPIKPDPRFAKPAIPKQPLAKLTPKKSNNGGGGW